MSQLGNYRRKDEPQGRSIGRLEPLGPYKVGAYKNGYRKNTEA